MPNRMGRRMRENADSRILNDDFFYSWEKELQQRRQLRNAGARDSFLSIDSEEELGLLWRALYYTGHRDVFWAVLVRHLHLSLVLNWLTANDDRWDEFLAYLPAHFSKNKPDKKNLQHLVHLFAEKFQGRFQAIAAFLDAADCSYLASRSANPKFRELIQQRLHFLQEQRNLFFYGLEEQITNTSMPSLHGDKIKLLTAGLELMQIDRESKEYRLDLKLEIADTFFRAGMIADSLALVIEAINLPSAELNTTRMAENKVLAKLLRKAAAIYALIYRPDSAGSVYSQIYHDYFPFLDSDPATLKYFAVYDLLKISRDSATIFPLYQIAFEAEMIRVDRNSEYLLLSKADLDEGLSAARIAELKTMVEQKLISLPHEAFITMQMIGLLMDKGLADPRLLADFLWEKSMELFYWVPSRLFIDPSFLQNHGPFIKDESREEGERILSARTALNNNGDNRVELYLEWLKNKDMDRMRHITAGHFLGVL